MALCGKCGTELPEGAAFCRSCGARTAGALNDRLTSKTNGASLSPNVAGLLAYALLFITGILFLALEPYKNDKFVRFHAFQAIFFSVAAFRFWLALSVLSSALVLSRLMGLFLALIGSLIPLFLMLYGVFLMHKAYHKERYMIPLVGRLAARRAD
jgi:uncharacterized membrane protein